MKNIYFTAGPSQIYPSVPGHIKKAIQDNILSIFHRGETFQKIFSSVQKNLRKLLAIPEDHKIFFLSSATEAWERILENCVEKTSFHLVNGAFSRKFSLISEQLKKTPILHERADGEGFMFNEISVPTDAELVCITHNESSTGVMLDMNDIHLLKKRYPEKLFALDTVSSMPYVDVDFSLIDCVFFSVQKGFGLPAGLGVLVVSPAAMGKSRILQTKGLHVGSYHSFQTLARFAQKNQTPETPNVLDLYLLHAVTAKMLQTGIKKIRSQTDEKAKLLYDFFKKNKSYELFVRSPSIQSKTVVAVKPPKGSDYTINRLKKQGLIVSRGYGKYKEKYIRISNFPAHSVKNIKKLLQYL